MQRSKHSGPSRLVIAGGQLLLAAASVSAQTNTWYVDAAAGPGGNGLSWATAFVSLDTALAAAASSAGSDEIRVGHGSYVPTTRTDPLDARSATFILPAETFVVGGWIAGQSGNTPLGIPGRTRLSGEIGMPGAADNVYHVVTHVVTPVAFVLDYRSSLSRLVVEDGNADGAAAFHKNGGGIHSERVGSLQVQIDVVDVTIRDCRAQGHGGGMYVSEAVAGVSRCSFQDNIAGGRGGAIEVSGGLGVFNSVFLRNEASIGGAVSYGVSGALVTPPFDIIANSRFFRNQAKQLGGAVAFDFAPAFFHGDPGMPIPGGGHYVTNCTFSENEASVAGGAIGADIGSDNLIRNTVTWDDTAPTDPEIMLGQTVRFCIVEGGYAAGFPIWDLDPLLGPAQVPAAGSPVLGQGDTFVLPNDILDVDQDGDVIEPLPIDVRGAPRVQGVVLVVDIGAHEIG